MVTQPSLPQPVTQTRASPQPDARIVDLSPHDPRRRLTSSSIRPEFIEAVINEDNGVLRGTYRARYKVPDRPVSPEVNFQFIGRIIGDAGSVPVEWNRRFPRRGFVPSDRGPLAARRLGRLPTGGSRRSTGAPRFWCVAPTNGAFTILFAETTSDLRSIAGDQDARQLSTRLIVSAAIRFGGVRSFYRENFVGGASAPFYNETAMPPDSVSDPIRKRAYRRDWTAGRSGCGSFSKACRNDPIDLLYRDRFAQCRSRISREK